MDQSNLKIPPNSMLSEEALLGAIFMNPKILPEVQVKMSPSDMYRTSHSEILEAMISLHKSGEIIEPSSVITELDKSDKLEKVGGQDYILHIVQNATTSTGWKYHVSEIVDTSMRRQLITVFSEAQLDLFSKVPTRETLSAVKSGIMDIEAATEDSQTQHISKAIPKVLEVIGKGISQGVPSGFYKLDKTTSGWQAGDLIIIAGRPGMGKSVIAKDFAEASKVPTLYFSLEMSREQLIKRQFAGLSGVDHDLLRSGKLQQSQWDSLVNAADKLIEMPIYYNDSGKTTIGKLCAIAETYKMNKGIGLVIIDYLQLIRSDVRGNSREQEVSAISRELKLLARSLDIPVICLAQLNRKVDERKPPVPVLSDLRESGAIEQDADFVGFLYRPWMYDKAMDPNEAHFYLAKGRNTRTGKIDLIFNGANQIFRNPWRVD